MRCFQAALLLTICCGSYAQQGAAASAPARTAMPSVLLGQKGASHNTSSELINPLFGWRIDPEIETLAGSAGTALAMMLFLSPLPTFRKMVADGTTSDFLPDPYLSALCNCGLWVVYAVPSVTPNRLLPLACNCAGVLLQLVYAVVFGMYVAPATRWRYRIMLFITVVMLSGKNHPFLLLLSLSPSRNNSRNALSRNNSRRCGGVHV